MLRLFLSTTEHHNPWMSIVAVVLCVLGCYATFAIGVYAVESRTLAGRLRWGAVTLMVTASTVWGTDCIAMIALHWPHPSGFLASRVVASAGIALLAVGFAGSIALSRRHRPRLMLAGIVTGFAIAATDMAVMSAFRTVGTLTWEWPGTIVALAVGSTFGGVAGFMSWDRREARVLTPALLMTAAICGHHFIAMGAATVAFDPSIALPAGLLPAEELSLIVAGLAASIACIVLVLFRPHLRATRQASAERKRFLDFADFSVEGILICDGDSIVWANHSIETMTGTQRRDYIGRSLDVLFEPGIAAHFSPEREVDAVVRGADGETPVRVITKSIQLAAGPHTVVAVRDQRERLRAEAEVRRLAQSDALTGLANRARFNEMLERLLSSRRAEERSFALLSLDLDGFKKVNDAHGQGTGDALLVCVAGRLGAVVRESHLVARIGGDEFSIISPQIDGAAGARALADRIVEILSRPFVFDGQVHEIAVSVGVTLAPSDGNTASVLVRNADLALDRAKEDGGNAYRMFEAGMDARMQARRAMELALRRASVRQEFELYYQPQVDARSGRYTGAEALIRWNDPERGLVPPSEFIGIAEETNLIAGIGEWVLRTACLQAASWPAPLNVAVNLSPVQFRDPRLAALVASALEESGLPGHRLELEITESVLIDDEVGVLAMLEKFRAMGVRISLDDFGTGYSSLGHLRRFPFDKIKIDRSFVSRATEDRECAAIVRAIVSLGTSLGIKTVAEGVETAAQRRFVTDEGCNQIQGYLFSRPVPFPQLPPEFRPTTAKEAPWPSSSCSIAATAN